MSSLGQPSSSTSEQPELRIRRIRQACRNCRRKKARCSGERPICAFCSRLSQDCFYSDNEDAGRATETEKRKRDEDNENAPDKDDFHKRLSTIEAKLSEMAETMTNIATSLHSNSTSDARSPRAHDESGFEDLSKQMTAPPAVPPSPFTRPPALETIIGAADVYFRYCHNQPYSLFHEESFRSRLASNELPQHLLFAFLASAVRYSTDPYYEDKMSAISTYSMQAWKAMVLPWNGIESDVGITIVQTILLLAIIDYTDGKTQGAWIKVGLAIRIAQDFRLMLEADTDLAPTLQEERRRVFWSFYIADKLISCGQERPPAILDGNCRLRLPCDEHAFRSGGLDQMPTLDEVTGERPTANMTALGPFAMTTVMASVLGRCAQYTLGQQEELVGGAQCSPWSPKSMFSLLHSMLMQLESDLRLGEPLTGKIKRECTRDDGTIDQHRGAPLVFSHALFYLCQCLLYHPFLLKKRLAEVRAKAPVSFIAQAFEGCKAAARSLSRLMDEVKMLDCEALSTCYDPFYGYCTMVAGTIHSLFSHSNDPEVVGSSHRSLEISIANLEELSVFWKSSSYMMERLLAFNQDSVRYAVLIDPTIQLTNLSPTDLADLAECLDYSRLSTTPRRKSQSGSDPRPLVSNLPSPFFDDFLNLLPLNGNFSFKDFEGVEPATIAGNEVQLRDNDTDSGVFRTFIQTPETAVSSTGDTATVRSDGSNSRRREQEPILSRSNAPQQPLNAGSPSSRSENIYDSTNGHHTFTVKPLPNSSPKGKQAVSYGPQYPAPSSSAFSFTQQSQPPQSSCPPADSNYYYRFTSPPPSSAIYHSQPVHTQVIHAPRASYSNWQPQQAAAPLPSKNLNASPPPTLFDPFSGISPSLPPVHQALYSRPGNISPVKDFHSQRQQQQQQQYGQQHDVHSPPRRLSMGVRRRPWYVQGTAVVDAGT